MWRPLEIREIQRRRRSKEVTERWGERKRRERQRVTGNDDAGVKR